MTATDFQVDELLLLTMKVRVARRVVPTQLVVVQELPGGDRRDHVIDVGVEGQTIERVAPANWPPRPGDKWKDRFGGSWFAMVIENALYLVPATPLPYNDARHEPQEALDRVGPFTLVHRDDEHADDPFENDDDPKTWTDATGHVWDLTVNYTDESGNIWQWAGGFEYEGARPQPLMSRGDWSVQDVRLGNVIADWGKLTPVVCNAVRGGEIGICGQPVPCPTHGPCSCDFHGDHLGCNKQCPCGGSS